jgi:hypothetical protein
MLYQMFVRLNGWMVLLRALGGVESRGAAGRVRRPLQPASPALRQEPAAAGLRRHHHGRDR